MCVSYLPRPEQAPPAEVQSYTPSLSAAPESFPTTSPPGRLHVHGAADTDRNLVHVQDLQALAPIRNYKDDILHWPIKIKQTENQTMTQFKFNFIFNYCANKVKTYLIDLIDYSGSASSSVNVNVTSLSRKKSTSIRMRFPLGLLLPLRFASASSACGS